MRCGQAKKLLFSGCADRGISSAKLEDLRRHLTKCARCRAVEKELEESVIMPFEQAARYIPSEQVWENIKASIEPKPSDGFLVWGMMWLRKNLVAARPAFAAATVVALLMGLIIAPRAYHDLQDRKIYYFIYEEMDFFYSLGENNGAITDEIGIPAEDLFM